MLLAIDPGTDTGWALFDSRSRLVACGLGEPRQSECHRVTDISKVVIEKPVIYRTTKNPNDIVTLAVKVGEWSGVYKQHSAEIVFVTPHEWKGSLSKEINHARLWAKLTEAERVVVDLAFVIGKRPVAPSRRHNVLDAIGIGLWAVKR